MSARRPSRPRIRAGSAGSAGPQLTVVLDTVGYEKRALALALEKGVLVPAAAP